MDLDTDLGAIIMSNDIEGKVRYTNFDGCKEIVI